MLAGTPRSFARFGARLALARASSGDVEGACEIADQVIASALQVDSATVRADLGQLARILRRWPKRPEVSAVQAQLNLALHTMSS